ncbi:MAG: YkgJ family cysteine cluster protein [Acidilobaceae archaeon]
MKKVKSRRLADRFDFVNFSEVCRNCNNNCCRRFYSVLLPEEEELFESFSDEVQTPLGIVKTLGSPSGTCPFLDKNGFCRIYKDRPMDCRVWPVIMYYDFKTNERVIYLDLDCEAVRENRVPVSLINKIVEVLKNTPLDDEWLKSTL